MNLVRIVVLLWLAGSAGPVMSQSLMTSASNVRLRSAPATDAAVVAMLPLGTELEITGPDRRQGWIPVRTALDQAQQGWVAGSLTLPVSTATYQDVVAGLIAARLAREGDSFVARAELLDLIESVLRRDSSADATAQLELQRLRALQGVLRTIPFVRSHWPEPMREWVANRSDEIRYNEPGGSHIEEAAARISWVVEDQFSAGQSRFYFEPQRDCDALAEVFSPLETALSDSRVLRRTELVGQLRQKLTLCP
jgi:hypothetical protein